LKEKEIWKLQLLVMLSSNSLTKQMDAQKRERKKAV
jgi:hypothetical protein